MSLTLAEFYNIGDLLMSYSTAAFNALNSAYIIDDGAFKLSLFELALGFVILEFAVSIINRLRGNEGDFYGDGDSTGRNPYAHRHGQVRYPRGAGESPGKQTFGRQWRGR